MLFNKKQREIILLFAFYERKEVEYVETACTEQN